MDFGYHNSSFVYHGTDDDKSLVEAMTDRAQLVEDAGFTWYTLMDHFWQLAGIGHHDEPFVECYTGLSAIAQATERMELSALVTCVHYRNPGYLAKTMATLDHLSEGRGVLAIGGGWYTDEYDAVGIEYPDGPTRIRQTRDAIQLCKAAWNEPSPLDYEGEYYDLDGFYCDPKPEEIPVLVGGAGEQLTLRLVAHHADRWNYTTAPPDDLEHKLSVLEDHCERYDRPLEDVEITFTCETLLRATTEAAHDDYERLASETENGPTPRDGFRGLVGTPAEAAELVETYRDLGVDTFQIQPVKNDRQSVELFVDEVQPQF
jgi:alkanesulfonate monooxygenase SsuD/methylene tetrahydromethanopterin reductase-like flavin-dependent oxidoreductase (luciferase family)